MILAASTTAAAKSSSSGINIILIIVVLFGVLYFVMIRPQRNRQRKVQAQQSQVQPGQRVRTTAGMYATVVGVDGDDVILEVSPGVEVRYVKRAIMQVLPDEEAPAEPGYEAGDETTAADDEAGYDEAGHDEAGYDEADAHEADAHEAGAPLANGAGEVPPHATGGSPNGTPAAADESRTQGTL
jgi:preprotein translocase subunit YajC